MYDTLAPRDDGAYETLCLSSEGFFADDGRATGRAVGREAAIIMPVKPPIQLTPQQRRAVETAGHSVIVTAAAGSGKTAVLAQRCAYLVCDAPPPHRCDVDELLVLTFTDAAAAEMRSRIVEAIRARLHDRPDDARLREQVALTDAAHISTIHAFCLWLIRRWFNEADVDPAAALLDEHEAPLLKREVLDGVFEKLYEHQADPDRPLGTIAVDEDADKEPERIGPTSLGAAFASLVDVYGLGSDRAVASLVLDLYEFTASLPDPDQWLEAAAAAPRDDADKVILSLLRTLPEELDRQLDHCRQVCSELHPGHKAVAFFKDKVTEYGELLKRWRTGLGPIEDECGGNIPSEAVGKLELLGRVCCEIGSAELTSRGVPRVSKDTDPAIRDEVELAREAFNKIKKTLFVKRLQERYGLFTIDEWRDGLRRTAPFVCTIVELVRLFGRAYAARKRTLNVLDFSDLERFAHKLLHDPNDLRRPSPMARALHDKFAHVLVDEFQDINPLQQELLRLASHESREGRAGNLFVVGDVKQSIYRFRLAEPDLFVDRLRRFRKTDSQGEAVALQKNFRSRAHVLDAINTIFRVLMPPGCGAVEYDEEAVLHPGRDEPTTPPAPIELHLLERRWGRDDTPSHKVSDDAEQEEQKPDAEDERRPLVPDDPSGWSAMEREGHLIGRRIRAWMESGVTLDDGGPLEYRDIAVLLRAAKVNAEQIAAMLSAMNIPAFAAVGGSLFAAVEVRDVLAALSVLDNTQQDIPLVAVLRSGVLGQRFSQDDLLAVRLLDQKDEFHRVLRRYPADGDDPALRERLGAFLEQVQRLRSEGQRRPPAELLGKIYGEFGHMAHSCGLPDGPQRRANLLKLQDLARKFGTFRRQGLQRFLRFIDAMSEDDRSVALASAIGESENVVRIMSIHQSKGLEFPVVFLAGLGNRFNLGDRSGRMIYEREAQIGLRVVDTERMIEYPSAAYARVVDEVERQTRAEELRILYVAMTRARDRLVMIGSCNKAEAEIAGIGQGPASHPSSHAIGTASTPFDWLVPAIRSAGERAVASNGADTTVAPGRLFDVRLHTPDTMASWRVSAAQQDAGRPVREAVASLAPLPASEPTAPDDPEVEAVQARLDFVYPYLSTSSVRATVAASEHKGLYDFTGAAEAPVASGEGEAFAVPPSKYGPTGGDTSARRGIAMHRVLQHLDFDAAHDGAGVASELQRLIDTGVIRGEDRGALDEAALVWFVGTPLAASIRQAGATYRREFQYVAAEPPTYFDRSVEAADDDFVLVRGVVDGILPVAGGVEVIDFKTDAIGQDDVSARVERYRPQMELYARAVTRIWQKPVAACRLVFLTPRVIEAVADLSIH